MVYLKKYIFKKKTSKNDNRGPNGCYHLHVEGQWDWPDNTVCKSTVLYIACTDCIISHHWITVMKIINIMNELLYFPLIYRFGSPDDKQ